MMLRMEEFSFFESAVIDRIFHDLEKMDYGDFDLSYKDFLVSVTYQDQSAVLDFTGPTEVKMKLTFDDLVPCFIDYAEVAD